MNFFKRDGFMVWYIWYLLCIDVSRGPSITAVPSVKLPGSQSYHINALKSFYQVKFIKYKLIKPTFILVGCWMLDVGCCTVNWIIFTVGGVSRHYRLM